MKTKVWLEIFPGFAFRGVTLKYNWWRGYYCLYRDADGKCRKTWFSSSSVIERL